MRIGGIEKLGYYKTPNRALSEIKNRLAPVGSGHMRLLDPCAGEGEALQSVGAQLKLRGGKLTTHGVEISEIRQRTAATQLDECLLGDWASVSASDEGFSLLWLNPPYDHETGELTAKKRRTEYIFLRDTTRKVQPGGVLVYIVPISILQDKNTVKLLSTHYEKLAIYRFPAGEYAVFKQIVIFGYRKAFGEQNLDLADDLAELTAENLPPAIDEMTELYRVPAATRDKLVFRRASLTDEEIYTYLDVYGASKSNAWKKHVEIQTATAFHPAVPLKIGHLGGMMSSGQMGVIDLGDKLIKGRSIKVPIYYDANGQVVAKDSDKAVKMVEKMEARIFTITPDGTHTELAETTALSDFLITHATAIGQQMAGRFSPRYNEPTQAEWNAVSQLALSKKLPGRKEGGLLPAQKHTVLAAARTLRKHHVIDLIGEQGVGKTVLSPSIVAMLDCYPAVVLCPGHLVEKWQREIAAVIPGASAIIAEGIQDLEKFRSNYKTGEKKFVIIGKEKAKLASGWENTPASKSRAERLVEKAEDGTETSRIVTGKRRVCPTCGQQVLIDPKRPCFCPNEVRKWDNETSEWKTTLCNAALFQMGGTKKNGERIGVRRFPLAVFIGKKMKGFFKVLIADEYHLYRDKSNEQSRAYDTLLRATKYHINLTGTLFGGKASDIFYLMHRNNPEVRHEFAFHEEMKWAATYGRLERYFNQEAKEETAAATLSGKAKYVVRTRELPGISPQLYRLLLERAIFLRISDLGFKLPAYKEIVVKLAMNDLQAEQYQEEIEEDLLKQIKDWLKERSKFGRERAQALMPVWFQRALGRPNSGFREEEVYWSPDKERIPYRRNGGSGDPLILSPVIGAGERLPKEEWLVSTVKHEIAQQRKSLIYVRQTGTLDIQPRLVELLKNAGVRAVCLPDNIPAKQRERWIEERMHEIDALIVNPRKVETGLDLIKFANCIFYELDYSLFTLWQAMRRVWRLGQTQPVKVFFPVYEGTMEARALALMGSKMGAAYLLYGDNAASALTAEGDDEGDLMAALTASALAKDNITLDGFGGLLKQLAGDTAEEWGEPEESPVAAEPSLAEPEPVIPQDGDAAIHTWLDLFKAKSKRRPGSDSGNGGATPAPQMSFLDMLVA